MAVQERDGALGLWAAEVQTGAVAMEVARQAILYIITDSSKPPEMTCVARTGNWNSGGLTSVRVVGWEVVRA